MPQVFWLGTAGLCAFFLTALSAFPLLGFIRRGWRIRKQEIFSSFSAAAKEFYLQTFVPEASATDSRRLKTALLTIAKLFSAVAFALYRWGYWIFHDGAEPVRWKIPGAQPGAAPTVEDQFRNFYSERYGRRHYVLPVLLFVLLCYVLTLLLSQAAITALLPTPEGNVSPLYGLLPPAFHMHLDPVAAAAIAGAYLWIIADFFDGCRRNDMQPADIWNATLRLTFSVSIGIALSGFADKPVAASVAFAAGAFPLASVRVLFRRLVSDRLKLGQSEASENAQIVKLDGIDKLTADRLQDYGITTIPQLAYCDPVQLCMRTGFAFDFIADACAQALAWNYLGDGLTKLRPCGLRSSGEIWNLHHAEPGPGTDATFCFAAGLLYAGQAGGEKAGGTEAFHNAVQEIAEDPYTIFLALIWNTRWEEPLGKARDKLGCRSQQDGVQQADVVKPGFLYDRIARLLWTQKAKLLLRPHRPGIYPRRGDGASLR